MSHFWAHLACFFKNRPNLLFLTRNGRVHFWKFWSFDQNRYKYSRGFYKGVPSSRNAFKSHYAKLLSLLSGFLTKQWAMSSIWGQKTGHSGLYRNMHFSKSIIWVLKRRFCPFWVVLSNFWWNLTPRGPFWSSKRWLELQNEYMNVGFGNVASRATLVWSLNKYLPVGFINAI